MPSNSSAPHISVIVINYNGGAFLQAAVDSLGAQTCRDFELVLLDNNSTDGSVDRLNLDSLPASTIIREPENHGYATGNNLAVAQAKGDWIVLLNPDTVASPDFLKNLLDAQAKYPHAAAFNSCQYLLNEPDKLDGVGDAYLIFGFPWRGGFGHPASIRPGIGEVFSPCGAGAMIRRDVFLEHGGFDSRFFMYCEDVDLGFRMQLAGETCIFVPDALIHHAGSGISGRYSERTIYHGTRNRIWTYVKNMPTGLLLLTLPGHLILSAYLLGRAAMTGRAGPVWRGMKDGAASAFQKRRSPDYRWTGACVSSWRLARTMAWNPFRMSQRLPHVRPVKLRENRRLSDSTQ